MLLVSSVVAQQFILTSDESVEITRGDTFSGSRSSSGSASGGDVRGSGSGSGSGSGGSGGRGGRLGPDDNPSSNPGRVPIFVGGGGLSGFAGGMPDDNPRSDSSSSGAMFARFAEPTG